MLHAAVRQIVPQTFTPSASIRPTPPPPPRPSACPQVCSSPCDASDALCQPLKAFRLRLADGVLAAPAKYIKQAVPEGTLTSSCAGEGQGWWMKGPELLSLAANGPAEVRAG